MRIFSRFLWSYKYSNPTRAVTAALQNINLFAKLIIWKLDMTVFPPTLSASISKHCHINVKVTLSPCYAMNTYGTLGVQICNFLTWAIVGGASRPCRFTLGERTPGTQWIGGWVGPRAGMDDVENRKILILTGTRTSTPRSPSHSQSLYRLYYATCSFQ
jgi:hypothetical protein